MASSLDDGLSPPALIGYAIAAITVLVAWLRDRRKGDIDESSVVLGKWKELVDAHEKQIERLEKRFEDHQTAAAAREKTLLEDLHDVRARLRTAEKRIDELETENRQLQRVIAQNSQSTAYQIGRFLPPDQAELVESLDRAGHNHRSSEP